jgi:ribonuclease D
LGRTKWVSEECKRIEQVRYQAPDLETAYLSVKGAENLDGRGLAILRSLFLFREEEARHQHRPPFFIMPDTTLISLATTPTTALSAVPGLWQGVGSQRFRQGLQQALSDGLGAPLIQPPTVVSTGLLSPEQLHRLGRLKVWRASLGAAFSLDPALLWPTASLERLAKTPDTFHVEVTSSNIRGWQRDQFASSLRGYLESNV